VNVEEFSSEVVSAPMSGETLFKASARLQLPAGCDLVALKKDLEKIAADLLVDVSFAEIHVLWIFPRQGFPHSPGLRRTGRLHQGYGTTRRVT
jgi:hypothetical protein